MLIFLIGYFFMLFLKSYETAVTKDLVQQTPIHMLTASPKLFLFISMKVTYSSRIPSHRKMVEFLEFTNYKYLPGRDCREVTVQRCSSLNVTR